MSQPAPHGALRVFLSSTSVDLEPYRDRVASLVQHGFGQFAVTMNYFPLEPHKDATTASLDQLASCQVYVLLLAWRYGHVPHNADLSVTHQEYREAQRLGLPCFVFLADERTRDDLAQFPAVTRDPEHEQQLLAFRAEVQRQQLVGSFTMLDDLVDKVTAALHTYLLSIGRLGRTPRDLPPHVHGFVGRERELAELCANLRAGQATELSAALAGLGGVGKSALASEAVRLLAAEPGAFPGGIAFVRCDGRAGLEGLAWVEQWLLDAWEITLSPEQVTRATTSAEAEVEVTEQALRRRLRVMLHPPTPSQGSEVSGQAADNTPLPAGATALVVLDNVEPGLPIDRLLDTLSAVGVTALVTARHLLTSSRVQTQRLETLVPDAARALFRERYAAARQSVGMPVAPRSEDTDDAHEASAVGAAIDTLTSLLGYLPLAIELAAARAGRLGLSPAEAAQEFQQARDRGELLVDPHHDPTKSLGVVLDKSLTTLTERQRLRFAALALPQGPDWPRATIEVFLALVDAPDTEDAEDEASADTARPASQDDTPDEAPDDEAAHTERRTGVRADLDVLVSLSLVTIVLEQVGEGQQDARIRVHPLLLERAQHEWEQWRKRSESLRTWAAWSLLVAVRETLLPYVKQARTYRRLDTEEAVLEGALTALAAVDSAAAQRLVAQTVADLREYLFVGGYWRLGQRLLQMQLAARRAVGDRAGEGTTLNNLGLLSSRLGQPEEARRYYEQALIICRAVGDRASEGVTLNNLGSLADDLGQKEEARRYIEQALALAREVGDRAGEGTRLNNLGSLADDLGQPEEARRYYEQALALARAMGDRATEGTTLNNLGLLSSRLGQPEEARRYYEQALALARAVGDRAGEGGALNNLGDLASDLVQQEEARRYFELALIIFQAIGNRVGEGTALNNLGSLAHAQGQVEEARRYFEQALTIMQEVGDRAHEAGTLNNLGGLAYDLGQPEEARRYIEQALAIARKIGDHASEGTALNNLGGLADKLGQPEEAQRYFEQALAIMQEVGDSAGEGTALNNLGYLALEQGYLEEATRYYQKALVIRKRIGYRAGEGTALYNLGHLARRLGQSEEARRYYEQSLAIFEAIGMPDKAQVVRDNLAALASSPSESVSPASDLEHKNSKPSWLRSAWSKFWDG